MKKHYIYFIILGILALMIIHIELILSKNYAPETVLVKVNTPEGLPENNATCFGDISSEQINIEKKPLKKLESIYDFINPDIYYSISFEGGGYYLLETGFENYGENFEIRIICYSPNFSGISYTIINNTNTNCEVKNDGKLLVC